MSTQGIDATTCVTLVILGLLAIWWLLRSGNKRSTPQSHIPQPYSMDMMVGQEDVIKPQPAEPAPKEQAVIQNLEKKLAEMDEKISRMNQETQRNSMGAAWPQGGWNAPMAQQGMMKPLTPSPEIIRAEVYRLAGTGQSATDIAQTLNISRGEVELLLQMRND